jgi:hypothetical protein
LRTINNPDDQRFAYMTLGDAQDGDSDGDGDDEDEDDGDGGADNTKRDLGSHGKSSGVFNDESPQVNKNSRDTDEHCQ